MAAPEVPTLRGGYRMPERAGANLTRNTPTLASETSGRAKEGRLTELAFGDL